MPEDPTFRRNLIVVAALHIAFIGAVGLFSQCQKKAPPAQILWLEGGSIGGGEPADGETASTAPSEPPTAEPPPLPPPEPEKMELVQPPPDVLPAESEIVTPKATPEPATPKPITPKPATPKATPKPPPKVTPKPKATRADVSPKPKASPAEKPKGTPGAKKTDANANASNAKPGTGKPGGNGPGTGNGKGTGKTGNGVGEPQFGWYFSMLHDHFHTRWVQPTSIVRAGADFVTTLKIRIAKDGTISHREIVNSSSNPVMDESVLAAANKVLQLDPLPPGLGTGDFFEIQVNFKLDQGQ